MSLSCALKLPAPTRRAKSQSESTSQDNLQDNLQEINAELRTRQRAGRRERQRLLLLSGSSGEDKRQPKAREQPHTPLGPPLPSLPPPAGVQNEGSSESSSGSSSSDDERQPKAKEQPNTLPSPPPPARVQNEGSSSEAPEAAPAKARGMVCMWTWSCPRSYYQDADVRRKLKQLIPADLTREEVADAVKAELAAKKLEDQLHFLLVCREPHKRYSPATGARELHVHVILKMAAVFAHQQVGRGLAARGMVGHFSFTCIGLNAYLAYCLLPSGGKLAADLDVTPFAWPPTELAGLLAKADSHSAQQQARMAQRDGGSTATKKQRTLLTFSQLTDVVVENNIETEEQLMELAKAQKKNGNDVLLNTLGKDKSVSHTLDRIRNMWFPEQAITTVTKPHFPLSSFAIPSQVKAWLGGDKAKTLILSGDGGTCKTECALAVLATQVKRVHQSNKLEALRGKLRPGDGFVYDEACLSKLDVDDAKMLCDTAFTRNVTCRNFDLQVPKGVFRIFTTNHSWGTFWPAGVYSPEHEAAIRRRVEWVEIPKGSSLKAAGGGSGSSISGSGSGCAESLAGAMLGLLTGSPGTRKRSLDEIQQLASQSQASRPRVAQVVSTAQAEPREEEEDDPFGFQGRGVCCSGGHESSSQPSCSSLLATNFIHHVLAVFNI
jgi:hypothetical protein